MDPTGRIIGAVEIMKDMKAIKALVEEVSQPEKISFDAFVGSTPSVKLAIIFARKIASTPSIVSIRGESGTGKELFARQSMPRACDPAPLFLLIAPLC